MREVNRKLGLNRYEFLVGAYHHLFERPTTDHEAAKLEYLVRDFRLSALEEPKIGEILVDGALFQEH